MDYSNKDGYIAFAEDTKVAVFTTCMRIEEVTGAALGALCNKIESSGFETRFGAFGIDYQFNGQKIVIYAIIAKIGKDATKFVQKALVAFRRHMRESGIMLDPIVCPIATQLTPKTLH
jgi:hypothetical protein